MYRYIKNKDIDYKLWNECIDNSKNGIIYALSWYLDITAPGWDAIIKEENGKYVGVMPIPIFRKFGIKYIKQPILTQQLGFFNQRDENQIEEFEEIASIIRSKFRYVQKYEFNTGNASLLQEKFHGFDQQNFTTYHLDLNKTYRQIFKNYKKDRKWRINKAKRSNIIIEESENIDALVEIFHKNVAHKIYGVIGNSYEYKILKKLFFATKERGMNKLLSAEDKEGNILAMGLFFNYNDKIIYIFNASTPEGKNLSAISLVVDSVLKTHSGKPLCFDFESPEIAHVAEFYRRFGSVATPFLSISRNSFPPIVRAIKDFRFMLYRTFIDSPSHIQQ